MNPDSRSRIKYVRLFHGHEILEQYVVDTVVFVSIGHHSQSLEVNDIVPPFSAVIA